MGIKGETGYVHIFVFYVRDSRSFLKYSKRDHVVPEAAFRSRFRCLKAYRGQDTGISVASFALI